MTLNDIRKKFTEYYAAKEHAIIPSSSLVPENDPTTLLTGSGMQPLVPYLMGETHPQGRRLADSQRCIRAEDIEEVGDNRHTTFFEMLGNWSLGDYFKEEQLPWVFTFLVEEIGLDPTKLYVTCFAGSEKNDLPRDETSAALWQELFASVDIKAETAMIGSEEDGGKKGMGDARIFFYDADKNWWSRAGAPEKMPVGEIGGSDSEIFYDFGTEHDTSFGEHCHPNCDCGRFLEIGNSVFMEYIKTENGFEKLPKQNVDFGGGLERIAAAANDNPDVFATDVFAGMIDAIATATGKVYGTDTATQFAFRVIADHMRGSVFLIADGVLPSNTEQGYILRRLLRRAIRYADHLGAAEGLLQDLGRYIITYYKDTASELFGDTEHIVGVLAAEEVQFRKTLAKGLRQFEKMISSGTISAEDAFVLFSTYGFPVEMTIELASEQGIVIDEVAYQKAFAAHQEKSRTASAGKFKGGLAEHSEKTTALHTATHLMLAGLRKELGDSVHQAGSNITEERTRFDFTHDEKVSRDVLDRVEQYVNTAITAAATVTMTEMDKEQARAQGVEGSFWEKYPDTVKVYTMEDSDGTVYSQELCGGPHVANTSELAGTFRITKEQSSSAGVRRVKAILE